MTQKEIKARLKQLHPRLKRNDIKRASDLALKNHGKTLIQPASWTRFLKGELTCSFAFELYESLLQIVVEREEREAQQMSRIKKMEARLQMH